MLPGAREVLTQGLEVKPSSTDFWANKPAAIITEGLDVFVQDVIAAIATSPLIIFSLSPLYFLTGKSFDNTLETSFKGTLS